jgi:hypothetical protein
VPEEPDVPDVPELPLVPDVPVPATTRARPDAEIGNVIVRLFASTYVISDGITERLLSSETSTTTYCVLRL